VNAARLLEIDIATGKRKVITEDPQFDVSSTINNPKRMLWKLSAIPNSARNMCYRSEGEGGFRGAKEGAQWRHSDHLTRPG